MPVNFLIMGLGALLGGVLLVTFWDEIVDWLKKLVSKLKEVFRNVARKIAHAAGAFIQRVENGLAALRHKLYYKEEGQWVEETTTRKIKESEVPASIRARISAQEEEVTDEVESELNLSLN